MHICKVRCAVAGVAGDRAFWKMWQVDYRADQSQVRRR